MPLSNLKSSFSFKFSPRFASTISGSGAASRCCGREYACARHWNYCAGKNKLDLVFPKRAKNTEFKYGSVQKTKNDVFYRLLAPRHCGHGVRSKVSDGGCSTRFTKCITDGMENT